MPAARAARRRARSWIFFAATLPRNGAIVYPVAMEAGETCQILSAASQPSRLAILRCLASDSHAGDAPGLPAGEIARRLSIPAATLSFHLKDMTLKGLLSRRRAGRHIYYKVNIARLLEALEFMVTEVCEPGGRPPEDRAGPPGSPPGKGD